MRDGGLRDAVLYSVGANANHGLQRSREDKRNAIQTLLNDEEWGKCSDREIAKRCSVDGKTVARVRAESVTAEIRSEPSDRTFITKHGTVSTMQVGRTA